MKNPWDTSRNISYLEVYDIETKQVFTVKKFDYLIEAPNWSRDGKSLVYNSGGKIYSISLSDGEISKIESGFIDNCNNDHVLSPVNDEIAVSHGIYEDKMSRIFIINPQDGKAKLITPMAPSYLHGWSPDGKELAYCAQRNGEFNIYVIPVEGGVEKKLTDSIGLDDGPEYDPSGEYIWFNSVRSGLMQVWKMKRDGSEQTQMTFDENLNTWFPHVSPDGQKVVMLSYRKCDLAPDEHLPNKTVELRLMDSDGKNIVSVMTLFGGQGTLNVNSWSPCSKKFAFVRYEIKK